MAVVVVVSEKQYAKFNVSLHCAVSYCVSGNGTWLTPFSHSVKTE
jgi:hypothetical protein